MVTAGRAESNGSLPRDRLVYDSRHLQADYQEQGSAPEPYARRIPWSFLLLPLSFASLPLGPFLPFLSLPLRSRPLKSS